jgi:hypothetical protein
MLSLVTISPLKWIGHVGCMDSKVKVSPVFNNNPEGSRLRGRSKNGWWNFVRTDINKCKIKNWKAWSRNRAD